MQEELLYFWQNFGVSSATSIIISILMAGVWSVIFYFWKKSIDNKYQKQLENLKAKNDKLNYITKTQFDAEFKMYQELSSNLYNLIETLNILNKGTNYKISNRFSVKREEFATVLENLQILQKKVMQYASFIKEEIYNLFIEFIDTTNTVFTNSFEYKVIDNEIRYINAEYILENFQQKTKDIYKKNELIIQKLREYLQTLKVVDGNNEQNS